jgi:hypothetical protein
VKGLPLDATTTLLENEFKKFGPIRNGGVQVRFQKVGITFFSLFLVSYPWYSSNSCYPLVSDRDFVLALWSLKWRVLCKVH